ncbi:DUF1338 domain-containing protein [Thalassotalea ponticola]|uniref:DUF1338 domain-containing protein n=1 Tax=Thalassotalea ponticola TaxID=1523392 RepID=UPI0025B2B344|nr:DUF1338 domain-containing protein [Thalassotalea ponticola]MDN3653687.1 DUF1338 domain-containing protein [Thalassotalea ponticola]
MSNEVKQLFANIWQQYLEVTPSAKQVHQLLGNGHDIINDHVAYRTFNLDKVNLDKLAQHLLKLGYRECGEYHFEAKKLYAKHFEHADDTLPKVFISELLVEQLSAQAQQIIKRIVDDIDADAMNDASILYAGRSWDISFKEYQQLASESEYAAWLAAWGFRANHFTVSINHLANYENIEQVNQAIKDGGFELNSSGGEIKGDASVMLEQSSTMADKADVAFTDVTTSIPSCFYEFAKRYPMNDGKLYTGFVAASADKIFESTNN